MSHPLLLDEMFSDDISQQLRAKGYDAISVVADPALVGLPDEQVLAYAATEGRALVTANIKDFVPLDGRYRAAGQSHAGLILVSTKTFPQNRGFPCAVTTSLATLLSGTTKIQSGQVLFLARESPGSRLLPVQAPEGVGTISLNNWWCSRKPPTRLGESWRRAGPRAARRPARPVQNVGVCGQTLTLARARPARP